jgi:hypothetical protein
MDYFKNSVLSSKNTPVTRNSWLMISCKTVADYSENQSRTQQLQHTGMLSIKTDYSVGTVTATLKPYVRSFPFSVLRFYE